MTKHQPQVWRPVRAGIAIGRRHLDATDRDERTALVEAAGAVARPTDDEERTGNHATRGIAPGIATDGDQSAPAERTRIVARTSVHHDLTTRHAASRPGWRAAETVPGVGPDMQRPAAHRHAAVVPHAAADVDMTAGHPGGNTLTGITVDDDGAGGHRAADAVHVRRRPKHV